MKERHSNIDRTGKVHNTSIRTVIRAGLQNSLVRNGVVTVAIMIAALFVIFGVANADKPLATISALKSPIPNFVTVVLNCDENFTPAPNCTVSAATTSGATLYSYFYIDGRFRGTANKTYANVCTLFNLRDGVHTARVYARDAKWNSAGIGPYRVIHCDRFAPTVFTSLWYGRGWKVHIIPFAADYGSGILSKSFSVDGNVKVFQPYSDACAQLDLSTGWHTTSITATDNAAHTTTGGVRRFHCP